MARSRRNSSGNSQFSRDNDDVSQYRDFSRYSSGVSRSGSNSLSRGGSYVNPYSRKSMSSRNAAENYLTDTEYNLNSAPRKSRKSSSYSGRSSSSDYRNSSLGSASSNYSRYENPGGFDDYSRHSGSSSRRRSTRYNDYHDDYSRYGSDNKYAYSTPYGDNYTDDELDFQASQYSRGGGSQYSHKRTKNSSRDKRRKRGLKIFIACIILIVIGAGVYKFFPIKVTINGQEQTLTYDKSLGAAITASQLKVNPGNYIAVDYSVLQAGEGNEYYATVNNQETTDMSSRLHSGDKITYENGKDIMEEYTSKDSEIKASSKITGTGAIHRIEGTGEPGIWSKMTGKVSKKYAERQTKNPSNVTCEKYNIDPGEEKILAFTFDDGPSQEWTQDIIDVFAKYNGHATFFTVGENIREDWGKKLVKEEDKAGNQVCTHSYDHARGDGGGTNMTIMAAEDQIEEITKGQKMISDATGKECSKVVRLPGGNMTANTVRLIAPYATAEIGWNVDTGDWNKPGKSKIVSNMKQAQSGDVILCHDGGGDRSQTVEALKEVLPYFANQGYKFVTVDELMEHERAWQSKESESAVSSSTSGGSGTSSSGSGSSGSYGSYGYSSNY